jgi:uncharacterized protein YndB with AHSA1/START domain
VTARVQRVLPAPPEVVYDHWVSADALAGFICPAPGRAEVAIDPRPGGSLRIAMTFPEWTSVIEGEYLHLDRPHALSFSWRTPRGVDSVVSVSLEPHGSGETLMTITHSRLPADVHDDYQGGWASVSEQLLERLPQVT